MQVTHHLQHRHQLSSLGSSSDAVLNSENLDCFSWKKLGTNKWCGIITCDPFAKTICPHNSYFLVFLVFFMLQWLCSVRLGQIQDQGAISSRFFSCCGALHKIWRHWCPELAEHPCQLVSLVGLLKCPHSSTPQSCGTRNALMIKLIHSSQLPGLCSVYLL